MSNSIWRKVLIGLGVIGVGVATHQVKKSIDRKIAKYKKDEPWDTLMYALSRPIVICPCCEHTAAVTTLDAQLETRWECTKCSCIWAETSHMDVIIKEGKK